jgi:RTX calcium-binding nonapeptide repeat (4 copies)
MMRRQHMKRWLALVAQAMLLVSIAVPAQATDEPVQVLSESGNTDDMLVGLDNEGTATAVWTEGGTVFSATRAAGGKFGARVPIPGYQLLDVLVFSESGNGNAIVAGDDNGVGGIVASVRIGGDQGFARGELVSGTLPSGEAARNTDVAISDSGHGVVTWLQLGTNPPKVMASLFEGTDFSAPVMLDQGDQLSEPNAGIDAAGNVLVAWVDGSTANEAILGAAAPSGGTFGAPLTIEQMDAAGGTNLDLAVNPAGDAILAYEDAIPPAECPPPPEGCAFFRVEARYGNVSGTFGAVQPSPPDDGFGPGSHEVAIDDSGRAAVLMSMATPSGPAVLGRTSDDAGLFGPLQTISAHEAVGGPNIGTTNMAIAGWGGEFTAVFINDHDADGQTNEVYRSHTSGGVFGEVHQLSTDTGDDPSDAAVARNASGDYVAGWIRFVEELKDCCNAIGNAPHAMPVGTGPALTQGTEVNDKNLRGSGGEDIAFLGAGNDSFNALGGNDHVLGEGGSDTLKGGGGADFLEGGPGKDKLVGGNGGDLMDGGPGTDTCVGTKAEKNTAISCERFTVIK